MVCPTQPANCCSSTGLQLRSGEGLGRHQVVERLDGEHLAVRDLAGPPPGSWRTPGRPGSRPGSSTRSARPRTGVCELGVGDDVTERALAGGVRGADDVAETEPTTRPAIGATATRYLSDDPLRVRVDLCGVEDEDAVGQVPSGFRTPFSTITFRALSRVELAGRLSCA